MAVVVISGWRELSVMRGTSPSGFSRAAYLPFPLRRFRNTRCVLCVAIRSRSQRFALLPAVCSDSDQNSRNGSETVLIYLNGVSLRPPKYGFKPSI